MGKCRTPIVRTSTRWPDNNIVARNREIPTRTKWEVELYQENSNDQLKKSMRISELLTLSSSVQITTIRRVAILNAIIHGKLHNIEYGYDRATRHRTAIATVQKLPQCSAHSLKRCEEPCYFPLAHHSAPEAPFVDLRGVLAGFLNCSLFQNQSRFSFFSYP